MNCISKVKLEIHPPAATAPPGGAHVETSRRTGLARAHSRAFRDNPIASARAATCDGPPNRGRAQPRPALGARATAAMRASSACCRSLHGPGSPRVGVRARATKVHVQPKSRNRHLVSSFLLSPPSSALLPPPSSSFLFPPSCSLLHLHRHHRQRHRQAASTYLPQRSAGTQDGRRTGTRAHARRLRRRGGARARARDASDNGRSPPLPPLMAPTHSAACACPSAAGAPGASHHHQEQQQQHQQHHHQQHQQHQMQRQEYKQHY